MTRFEGKVVVVTGGANGIGKGTAELFAKQGATVCVVDLRGSGVHEIVTQIENSGGKAHAIEADVTKEEEVQRYVQETEDKFGGIDILFNNAGILGSFAPLDEYPVDIFDKVIDVNLKGVFLSMRYVAKAMKKRGGGAIVNMSSNAGLVGFPQLIAYSASKSAVIGMTRTAAVELATDDIRVNAVCPGPINTRITEEFAKKFGPENIEKGYELRIPLRRGGEVKEVSQLVTFLASDEASYITGGIYPIDGGFLAT